MQTLQPITHPLHIPPPRRDVLRWGEDEAADVCYDRAKARKVLRVSVESARAVTRLTLWGEKDGKRICAAHDCRARLCVVCRQNRRGGEGGQKGEEGGARL